MDTLVNGTYTIYEFLPNWAMIALGLIVVAMPLLELIVMVTPSEKDNKVLAFVQKMLKAIGVPNRKKGGGTHE